MCRRIILLKPRSASLTDSVLRKMRTKGFARSVNRDEIEQGASELGVPLEEHVAFVLAALQGEAKALGL